MGAKILAGLSILALFGGVVAAEEPNRDASFLLTPQRLRRLQRDRQRQTNRWVNFEARVESAPDSQERGFELALYYAVTHDEKRGREAIEWALKQACERRQFSLILDWCGELMTEEERRKLAGSGCVAASGDTREMLRSLEEGGFRDARVLYAVCERLIGTRGSGEDDPRRQALEFFSTLPEQFLLSLKPELIEHPDWMTHIAALALVAVDPNLEASQYLQGWAIEDRQTLREGPGVAYEFLWADPYLPGVGYQNLDPWVYDRGGRLFARTSWEAQSCWIAISRTGVEEENCPAGWRDRPMKFGHMTLIPLLERCVEMPDLKTNESAILWRLKPNQAVAYREGKRQEQSRADAAGLFRLFAGIEGRVCGAR